MLMFSCLRSINKIWFKKCWLLNSDKKYKTCLGLNFLATSWHLFPIIKKNAVLVMAPTIYPIPLLVFSENLQTNWAWVGSSFIAHSQKVSCRMPLREALQAYQQKWISQQQQLLRVFLNDGKTIFYSIKILLLLFWLTLVSSSRCLTDTTLNQVPSSADG